MRASSRDVSSKRKAPKADENSIALYLNEIKKVRLLSRAEEEVLAREAATGSIAAKNKLARAHLRFVVSFAKKYQHRGLPLEDLISEGNVGLLRAIDHFDVGKGYHFLTYAVWWIRQSILNAINEKARTIRLPADKAMDLARMENDRETRSLSAAQMSQLLAVAREPVSMDGPGVNASPLGDGVQDTSHFSQDEQVITKALRDDIEAVLGTLASREAEILVARFGLNGGGVFSLQELGLRFRLTKERIRQIEKRAMRQLREHGPLQIWHEYMQD